MLSLNFFFIISYTILSLLSLFRQLINNDDVEYQ